MLRADIPTAPASCVAACLCRGVSSVIRRDKKSPFLSPFSAPRCYFPCPNATENDSPQGGQLPGAIAFPIAATPLRENGPDQLQNRYSRVQISVPPPLFPADA